MNLSTRIEEVQEKFDEAQAILNKKQDEIDEITRDADNKIKEINQEMIELGAEMNRMQGEYRLLLELQEEQQEEI